MTSIKGESSIKKKFPDYLAAQELQQLARNPYDLTAEGQITPERLRHFCAEACGYKLLFGTERITEEVIAALCRLASECGVMEKMQKMQSGEILNFIQGFSSENRAVLHTAARDFFDNQQEAAPARQAAELARAEFDKLKAFMDEVDSTGAFSDLVMIGIGGSDLGPYANFLALEAYRIPGRRFFFINNVDPDNCAAVLSEVNLHRALIVVVSKSGTTLETVTNAEFVRSRMQSQGIDPKTHFVSVTGEESAMDDPALYRRRFFIWDWIGGRFSSSSMVGGLLIAFACGFDAYREFLRGANAMDKAALNEDIHSNLPLLGALLSIWNHNFLGYPTLAMIPYSRALRRYSAHIQQVEMESNGKHINRYGECLNFKTGAIIWGEPGTNAQHSFYQLIHQGTEIVPLEFIGFKEGQRGEDFLFNGTTSQEKLLSNLFAQAIALAIGQQSDNPNKEFLGNRPSHILLGKQVTPFSVGALLAYYEHKVAFEGFFWDINSFDQEGVQLGKVLANKIIARFSSRRDGSSSDPYPLGDALIDMLEEF